MDHLNGYVMTNIEVANGQLENLEHTEDTPTFNKIEKEHRQF